MALYVRISHFEQQENIMSEIRELTLSEVDDVSGGIIPAIIAIDLALIFFGAGVFVGYHTTIQLK